MVQQDNKQKPENNDQQNKKRDNERTQLNS